ncbi:MAG TPA: hypothetical protein VGI88_01555, partial [Verrucomicrobiae bacterium]
MPYPRSPIPPCARLSRRFDAAHVENPRAEVRERLLAAGLRNKLFPGARVAITAGSRGIGGFIPLLAGIADAIKAAGGKPFIIPAMGSHGGAVAERQQEILRLLGVTEETVGAPVLATMDTFDLGASESGAVAHVDKLAIVADGIIVLGRVKTHPESVEGLASGLLKMVTVGLGKQAGAQQAHSHGLWESVRAVPKLTLAKTKILFGVAVVENAYRQPLVIKVVPADCDAFLEADERLLKVAQPHVAKIPFKSLDVLVVDEIGKTISGSGMDTNVIGNWRIKGGKRDPDFYRIVALSLTKPSLGNGLGIGLADFTTERFLRDFDPAPTFVNLLTATEPDAVNTREGTLPLALPSDREAIEVALFSALTKAAPRVCRIKSTAQLDEFWVSESLLKEALQ